MRNSKYQYRLWCKHIRSCGLRTNYGKYSFARQQWNLYWDGVRDVRLADCAIYLIDKFGF